MEKLTLTCQLCGNIYKIGEDSSITTMEDVQGAGAMTVVISDGLPKTRIDLVMHFQSSWDAEWLEEKKQEGPGKIKFIRESIASGQKRFWYCRSCENDKSPFHYPKFQEADVAHSSEYYMSNGIECFESSDFDGAIHNFNKAMALDPNNGNIHQNLAGALSQKGDLTSSLEHFRKAVELEPMNSEIHRNYGFALKLSGDLNAAVEQYTLALGLDSNNDAARVNLANAFKELGRYSEAAEQCDIVILASNNAIAMEKAMNLMDSPEMQTFVENRKIEKSNTPTSDMENSRDKSEDLLSTVPEEDSYVSDTVDPLSLKNDELVEELDKGNGEEKYFRITSWVLVFIAIGFLLLMYIWYSQP
ncbi:MAG: tetratricopeptide repeat protein, partial [Flavobacteriaceae bacterium]